jgi:site-specific DNA-methyltransferase (adenine-specific)
MTSHMNGFALNVAQRGDALELLDTIRDDCVALVFFDPQFRALLDKQDYGNEGAQRQKRRALLPAMTESTIDEVCMECARVLKPGGYLMRWMDDFSLCEGIHLRISSRVDKRRLVEADKPFGRVGLISWDKMRMGQGHRMRGCGDQLLILQKPPIRAKATWKDLGIRARWSEKVDRTLHPHAKPIDLITRLIGAVTVAGDAIIDPAAGSFTVMRAAHRLGRAFYGCDIAYGDKHGD